MKNPELILKRLDDLSDDELIDIIKQALDESKIPYEEKYDYNKKGTYKMKTYKFNICKYTVTVTIEKKEYGTSSTDQKESGMCDVTYTPANQWVSTVNEPDYTPSFEPAEEIKMEENPVYGDGFDKSTSFYTCCEEYINSQKGILADSTLKGYKNIIVNHLDSLMIAYISEVTEELIQKAFDEEIAKDVSTKTLKGYKSFVTKVLTMFRPDLVLEIRVTPDEK